MVTSVVPSPPVAVFSIIPGVNTDNHKSQAAFFYDHNKIT